MLILYADANVLAKRYLVEPDSRRATAWLDQADLVASCRVAFVEVHRAIENSGVADPSALRGAFDQDWLAVWAINVDQPLVANAAALAVDHRLRSLDAIHLAAALSLRARDLRLATFDERLWTAARRAGLDVLPESIS